MSNQLENSHFLIVPSQERDSNGNIQDRKIYINDDCWRHIFKHLDWIDYNNFNIARRHFNNTTCNTEKRLTLNYKDTISEQLANNFHKAREVSITAGPKLIPNEYRRLNSVQFCRVIYISVPINFIPSENITHLSVFGTQDYAIEQGGYISQQIDHIEPILTRNNNITHLTYFNGYLSAESMLRLFYFNSLESLLLANIRLYNIHEFGRRINKAENLRKITILGKKSEDLHKGIFSYNATQFRQRITDLTIEIQLNEFKPEKFRECINLKRITIYCDTIDELSKICSVPIITPNLETLTIKSNIKDNPNDKENLEKEISTYVVLRAFCLDSVKLIYETENQEIKNIILHTNQL